MTDMLQRFIFENAPIRGEFIYLQESFQTIINQHDYPPALRQLLGEALCVAGLLSAIIKFTGKLTVQFRGKGRLKLLLAQCDNDFHLRGLIKWDGDLSYSDLMDAFNDGILVIMLDNGVNKKRYQGMVAWQGNSFLESIERYFQDSEQLKTKIWLNVGATMATGLLLQVVPSSTSDILENEKTLPDWERIVKLTVKGYPSHPLDCETLLRTLYPNEEIRIFPALEVTFKCTCSRTRGADAILLLGREEVEEELKDKQSIAVTCDFCNTEYLFDRIDVAKIFEDKGTSGTQLH